MTKEVEPARVVVTGASGFIGKHLCSALAQKGYMLRALVREGDDVDYLETLKAEIVTGDVRDQNMSDRLMEGAAGVFHLAGIIGRVGILDSEYWDVHVTATKRLLKAATKHGVGRFLHCSTAGIIGNVKDPPADEDTPTATNDIYRITKSHGEKAALASNGKKGLKVTVARPTTVYGPGDMRLYKFFRDIAMEKFKMIGEGKALVHPVYIDDLVEGMILAYQSEKAPGRVYILGGEKYLAIEEWAKIIAKEAGVELSPTHIPYTPMKALSAVTEKAFTMFGMEPPTFRRKVDFFINNRAYKIDRAAQELGYKPKVGLAEGARRTLAWYKERGLI